MLFLSPIIINNFLLTIGDSMSDLLSWNRPDSRFSTHTFLEGVELDCLFGEVAVGSLQNMDCNKMLNKQNTEIK